MAVYSKILLFLLTNLATYSCLAIERPVKDDLLDKIKKVFGEPENSATSLRFSLEELKDESSFNQVFDLRYDLLLYVDAGIDLGDLSAYGIKKSSSKSIYINSKAHPRWSALDELVVEFCKQDTLDAIVTALTYKEFDKNKLSIIYDKCIEREKIEKNAVTQVSITLEEQLKLTIQKYMPKIKMEDDPIKVDIIIKEYLYNMGFIRKQHAKQLHEKYFNWGLSLLNRFGEKDQENIVAVLHDRLIGTEIIQTEDKSYRDYVREKALLGQYDSVLNK